MTEAPDTALPTSSETEALPFESFSAIMEAFGDRFAEAIGVEPGHARTMKARGSIPPHRWPAVVKGAAAEGIVGVTTDLLAKLEEQRFAARKSELAAEETPQ